MLLLEVRELIRRERNDLLPDVGLELDLDWERRTMVQVDDAAPASIERCAEPYRIVALHGCPAQVVLHRYWHVQSLQQVELLAARR